MSKQTSLNLPAGNIRFAGVPRCWDDLGHNAFEITLPGRPPLYGEWEYGFADNEIDFQVKIVSFGYLDERNLANPYPDARQHLSCPEISAAKNLISVLFSSPEATASIAPFNSRKATYTGTLAIITLT